MQTLEKPAERTLYPITDERLLKFAQWKRNIEEEAAAKRAEEEAQRKARQQEENRRDALQWLTRFLTENCHMPFETPTEPILRFGDFELRVEWGTRSGYCLNVYAPAPYDIYPEPWEDDAQTPSALAGEMAYAGVSIYYATDLTAWLLDPTTRFPPQYSLPEPAPAEPVEYPFYPTQTPAPKARYIHSVYMDHLDTREKMEGDLNDWAEEGYRVQFLTVSVQQDGSPNLLHVLLQLTE